MCNHQDLQSDFSFPSGGNQNIEEAGRISYNVTSMFFLLLTWILDVFFVTTCKVVVRVVGVFVS